MFAHAHATHPQWPMAAGLVLAQLRAQLQLPGYARHPTLALLYITDAYAGFAGHVLQGLGGNVLKLLGQGAPHLHGVSCWLGLLCLGGLGLSLRLGCGFWFSLCLRLSMCLSLGLEHGRPVGRIDVHGAQRAEGHFLHFQRLNRGFKRGGVLLQPKQHGAQLFEALFYNLGVHGGGHPLVKGGLHALRH
ncbi:MAG: hypothetical protein EB072_21790 [Betaproteobacteria bacterium]|nr:hypothetical protein [Betaproteobacteria bacterium]